MTVSPHLLPRAERILDALIRELLDRGYRFGHRDEPRQRRGVFAVMDEEEVDFELVELMKQVRPGPYSASRKFDLACSGRLMIRVGIDGRFSATIMETKRWLLEDRLNHVIETMIRSAIQLKENRARIAAQAEEYRRRHEGDREAAEARRRNDERLAALRRAVTAWAEADRIRSFITAARTAAGAADCPSPELAEWLDWAEEEADRLDPLTRSADEASGDRSAAAATILARLLPANDERHFAP